MMRFIQSQFIEGFGLCLECVCPPDSPETPRAVIPYAVSLTTNGVRRRVVPIPDPVVLPIDQFHDMLHTLINNHNVPEGMIKCVVRRSVREQERELAEVGLQLLRDSGY